MFNSAPTRWHWNGVKHILCYLCGTTNMGLFYLKGLFNTSHLKWYANIRYLSYPHKAHLWTCYVFMCVNTTISWRSTKQILVVTTLNHSKIFTFHEESNECIWLRSLIYHIRSTSKLPSYTNVSILFKKIMLHVLHKSKADILKVI